MKKLLLLKTVFFLQIAYFSHAQNVAINLTGAAPHASAMLDVSSTTSGFLIPSLTSTERAAIPSPAQGLIIYNTTTNYFNVYNTAPTAGWFELGSISYIGNTTGSIAPGLGVAFNATGNSPAPSASCDVNSNIKGLLIPRTTAGAIISPATGLCIYNTTTNGLSYYNGSAWIPLCAQFVNNTTASGSLAGTAGVSISAGPVAPDNSAMLDISATSQGLLIPRMTDTDRNNLNPATGLLIYNTTTNLLNYWNGTGWFLLLSSPPATPGAIAGLTLVCPGTTNLPYSIAAVANATSYTWTVPTGWTITAGAGTDSITVTAGTTGQNGSITVTASNDCGTSSASTIDVVVGSLSPTVIYLTSGSSWTVPADWNSANNTIEVIGGGAGGGGGGGGGGGYSKVSNIALIPGAIVTYAVGNGGGAFGAGGDTYFCNSSINCGSIAGTAVTVGAKGGISNGGAGGAAAAAIGTIKYSGGSGGSFPLSCASSGGGGAAGPNGNGGNGGNSSNYCNTDNNGGRGGAGGGGNGGGLNGSSSGNYSTGAGGDGTSGGAGATGGSGGAAGGSNGGGGGGGFGTVGVSGSGGAGGAGQEWDATHGSGAGGGGNGNDVNFSAGSGNGGNGGLYGGGGGGSTEYVPGTGGQGIIVITYSCTP